jgi:hypothetical protein
MGANPQPQVVPGTRLPGTVNYFRGQDPAQWQTHLPTYNGLTYVLTPIAAPELCVDYALLGDWEQAAIYARHALTAPEFRWGYLGLTHWYETEALLRAGAVALAEEDLRIFEEHVAGNPRYQIPYLRSLAAWATWRGEWVAAATYLEDARRQAQALALPGELWQIEAVLAEMYLLNSEQARAAETFGRGAAGRGASASKVSMVGVRARSGASAAEAAARIGWAACQRARQRRTWPRSKPKERLMWLLLRPAEASSSSRARSTR